MTKSEFQCSPVIEDDDAKLIKDMLLSNSDEEITEIAVKLRDTFINKNGLKLDEVVNYIKSLGNSEFRENDVTMALKLYSIAISLDDRNAFLYANRSAVHIRLENYGYGLQDADRAIECDPMFVKGYYRRAICLMALGRYKEAVSSYEQVSKTRPDNLTIQKKVEECRRQMHRIAFERAICMGSSANEEFKIDVNLLEVPADYSGPKLDESGTVTLSFVNQLTEHFRNQKKLHKKYAYQILMHAREHFRNQNTLIHIDIPTNSVLTVCGDIHGQYFDLLNIFDFNGVPSADNPYLFNGDFVDRGSFSTECIFLLLAYKLLYPNHFFLTRGNHEAISMNEIYGFMGEVKSKYEDRMFKLFTEIFNYLPLCYILNNAAAVMHGGLFSSDDVTLEDVGKIDRNRQPPDTGIMTDILWSDPCHETGRHPSRRGVGLQFGPDVTAKFCENNKLKYIIRSHEMQLEGVNVMHNKQCITVFSAPNYCDSMNNKGAILRISHDLEYEIKQFAAVPHPDIKPMAYSTSIPFM
ncbi:hypothetical protein GJ496_003136 [Pomphorhynchus laevis]|nr:hypothetical protein GJ496_003136 [Pomphorhynchus laevis]